MTLLTPTLLLFALLALPILLLYMLKLRRREVPVSSTFLWDMLLRDRQANAPWQRLKRNLLLLLQLLILAALVLALARPAVPVPAVTSGSTIVLLDASASMHATDVPPSRFAAAVKAAHQLVAELPPDARMTIIAVGHQPLVIASQLRDPNSLRQALDSLAGLELPSNGSANWEAAFAMAAGSAGASSDTESTSIVIISDGGLPAELPPLPSQVLYVPVGMSSENLAISALALRGGANGPELFSRITNYGPASKAGVISFYRNGSLFSAQQVSLAAGESAPLVLASLPAEPAIFEARLSPSEGATGALDVLSLDDVALAVFRPEVERRALLFPSQAAPETRYNLFLQQVLVSVLGQGNSFQSRPGENGELLIPAEPFSVYVFDGLLPETLPQGNLLLINPPTNSLFEVGGIFTDTAQVTLSEHPLTQYVDWSGVRVLQARQVRTPGWALVLARTPSGPLIFAGETAGRRLAVLTFDLHDSDLPLQVAFPILFSNLIHYLAPAQAVDIPLAVAPGDNLTLPGTILPDGQPAEQIVVASPGEKVYSYAASETGISFIETGELGVYAVNYLNEATQASEFFSVNLFDEGESNIETAGSIQIGRTAITPTQETEMGLREFWPWLAGLALVVLMIEWWIYHRQQHLLAGLQWLRFRWSRER